MLINVPDPVFQTLIFSAALFGAVLLTTKKDKTPHEMNIDHTNQLKGLAILMVLFSHIGYFLDTGKAFLYPLSVIGGVGVDIFLFLSGFGLTLSALKSHHSILGFYWKRLSRIYLPMWMVVIFFLILDLFLLHYNYPLSKLIQIFAGFNSDANIYGVLNSPLWYFTFILFYYLIFPLVFWKRAPIFSGILILIISIIIINLPLPVTHDVLKLYKLHFVAFPVGIFFGILQSSKYRITTLIKKINPIIKNAIIAIILWIISYTSIHSGVGERVAIQQTISLITMTAFIFLILLFPFKSKFLILVGIYSYEIYLLQWPLLYRYDFLYKFLPAGLATILYMLIFISSSFCIQKIVNLILSPKSKK